MTAHELSLHQKVILTPTQRPTLCPLKLGKCKKRAYNTQMNDFSLWFKLRVQTFRLSLGWGLFAYILTGCTLPQTPPSRVKSLEESLSHHVIPDDAHQASLIKEWPGLHWWQQWQDHQLDQLMDQALQQAPSLDEAKARVQAAAALAEIQHSALKPSVSANVSPTYERFTADEFIPPPFGAHTYWDNQTLLESRFELDLWGKHHASLSAALDQLHATQAESAQVEQVLISDLIDTYLQLALEEALSERTETILHGQNRLLALAQMRRKAGLGTDLDVNKVMGLRTQVQTQLARQQTHRQLLITQLALLCGRPPSADFHLQPPTVSLTRSLHPPTQIPLRWLARRPDIIAAHWRVEADTQTIKVAKARFYPDINLNAFAGYQALGFAQLFSNNALMYGITPALSLPIFEGGHLQGALNIAAAQRDADIANYNQQLLQAMQEVSEQLLTLHGLDDEYQAAATAYALAQQDEVLTQKGYHSGLMDEAEQQLSSIARIQREQELARVNVARLRAEVHLIRALGGARPSEDSSPTVQHE